MLVMRSENSFRISLKNGAVFPRNGVALCGVRSRASALLHGVSGLVGVDRGGEGG